MSNVKKPKEMHKNSLANLKPFTSTRQPKNNGRKPSQLRRFIKENNVSREDVSLMIKNVLFSNSFEKLSEMVQDTKQPMIIRLFIKSFLTDFKKGNLTNLTVMLDRAFGSPKQDITVSGDISIAEMTYEEREARINEYIRKKHQCDVPRGNDAAPGQDRGIPGQPEAAIKEES